MTCVNLLYLLSFSIIAAGCTKKAPSVTPPSEILQSYANIFGNQDRVDDISVTLREDYPTRLIGLLVSPDKDICTASLVGENLIVTAAHCLSRGPEKNEFQEGDYAFHLGWGSDRALDASIAIANKNWYGSLKVRETYQDQSEDWAFLRLKKPLGKKWGYFKMAYFEGEREHEILDYGYNIAGYGLAFIKDQDYFYPTKNEEKCHLKKFDPFVFHHDCDAWFGDSGAPIYYCDELEKPKKADPEHDIKGATKQCYMVAMHVASQGETSRLPYYDENQTNFAVKVLTMRDKLIELYNKPTIKRNYGP